MSNVTFTIFNMSTNHTLTFSTRILLNMGFCPWDQTGCKDRRGWGQLFYPNTVKIGNFRKILMSSLSRVGLPC